MSSFVIQVGREEPAMSMDTNGKIIWAKHSEIQQANLKAMGDAEIKDGERLPLAVKDMGSCEIYPQTIQHNPNGRYASLVWALSLIIASPQDYADISTANTCIQFNRIYQKVTHLVISVRPDLLWFAEMGSI